MYKKKLEKHTFLVLLQSRDQDRDKKFYTDHVFHIVYDECRCDLCLLHTVGSDTILSLRPITCGSRSKFLILSHMTQFCSVCIFFEERIYNLPLDPQVVGPYHQACLSYLVTLKQWKRKYFMGIVLLSFNSLLSSGKGHR